MGVWSGSVRHARGRYAQTFAHLRRRVSTVEAEAHHLRDVEQSGASGETPYIAILGLVLFLAPVVIVFVAVALAVYFFV